MTHEEDQEDPDVTEGEEPTSLVSVTVDDEHLDSLDDVVEALRGRGLGVDSVLTSLGMVTGRTTDAAALREVEGVAAVDAQVEHEIAPPEDDLQ